MGIEGDGIFVSVDGSLWVRIFKIELPVARQEKPISSVAGLELRGTFESFSSLPASKVLSAGIADAGVGEKQCGQEGDEDECSTLHGVGETQIHSTVLCLEHFRVARQFRTQLGSFAGTNRSNDPRMLQARAVFSHKEPVIAASIPCQYNGMPVSPG
jgi:hypothetical protein